MATSVKRPYQLYRDGMEPPPIQHPKPSPAESLRRVAIDLQQEFAVGQRSSEVTVFDLIAVLNRIAREMEG